MTIQYDKTNCDIVLAQAYGLVPEGKVQPDDYYVKLKSVTLLDPFKNYGINAAQHKATTYLKATKNRRQQEAVKRELLRTEYLKERGRLQHLVPNETYSVQTLMGILIDYTIGELGNAKITLDQARRTISSTLDNIMLIELNRAGFELQKAIHTGNPNLTSIELQAMVIDSIEIGSIGREALVISNSDKALAFNKLRFKDYQNRMAAKGYTPQQITEILDRAKDYNAAIVEPRLLANALGVQVEPITNLGYIHRTFTNLAKKRLKDILPKKQFLEDIATQVGIATHPISASKRTFNFLIPSTEQSLVLLTELTGLSNRTLYRNTNTAINTVVFTPKKFGMSEPAFGAVELFQRLNPGAKVQILGHDLTSMKIEAIRELAVTASVDDIAKLKKETIGELLEKLSLQTGTDLYVTRGQEHSYLARPLENYTITETYPWLQNRPTNLDEAFVLPEGLNSETLTVTKGTTPVGKLGTWLKQGQPKHIHKIINDAIKAEDYNALTNLISNLKPELDALELIDNINGEVYVLDLKHNLQQFDAKKEVMDLMNDPNALLIFLRDKLTDTQRNQLVDLGILSSVPMSNMELYAYLQGVYDFGFDNPAQMFVSDINEINARYIKSLKTATKTSGPIQILFTDEAIQAGWAIDSTNIPKDSTNYDGFVFFGTQFADNLQTVLGFTSEEVARIKRLKVHPSIARLYEANLALSVNPAMQSQVAQFLSNVSGQYIKYMVGSGGIGYLARNLLETVSAAIWGQVNLARVVPSFQDILALSQHNSLDHLDNITPAFWFEGKKITYRQATEEFLKDYANLSAAGTLPDMLKPYNGNFIEWLMKSPQALQTAKQWGRYVLASGKAVKGTNLSLFDRLIRTIEAGGALTGEALDSTWGQLIAAAHISEVAVKHATYISQLQPVSQGEKIKDTAFKMLNLTFPNYAQTRQELNERMSNIFIDPETMGLATSFLNRSWGIFQEYIIKSPFIFWKAVQRNPTKFLAYARAHSVLNRAFAEDCGAGAYDFQDWELENRPNFRGCFTDSNGQKQYILTYPQNYDSFHKVMTGTQTAADKVAKVYLGKPLSLDEKLKQIKGEPIINLSQMFLENAGPLQQAFYESLSNRDILTGRQLSDTETYKQPSFLAWHVPAGVKNFIETAVPLLKFLDDFNPGHIFGKSTVINIAGDVVYEGQLGVLGNERYPVRSVDKLLQNTDEARLFTARIAKYLGINVRITTPERNIESNARKIDNTLSWVNNQFTRTLSGILEEKARGLKTNTKEIQRRIDATTELIAAYYWLRMERLKFDYMITDEYNALPPRQKDILTNRGVLALVNSGELQIPEQLINEIDAVIQDTANIFDRFNDIQRLNSKQAQEYLNNRELEF